jgi:hypothetical protein
MFKFAELFDFPVISYPIIKLIYNYLKITFDQMLKKLIRMIIIDVDPF